MKIALAQINVTDADLRGNARRIVDAAHAAKARGAELVVFPELCVTGYGAQDRFEHAAFLVDTARTLDRIAREVPQDVGVLVGAPVPNTAPTGKRLFNAALLYEGGRRVAEVHKMLLPTYDVYDEYRYFEPASACRVVEWRGLRLGVHLCEDMWNDDETAPYRLYAGNPVGVLAAQGVDALFALAEGLADVAEFQERHRRPLTAAAASR